MENVKERVILLNEKRILLDEEHEKINNCLKINSFNKQNQINKTYENTYNKLNINNKFNDQTDDCDLTKYISNIINNNNNIILNNTQNFEYNNEILKLKNKELLYNLTITTNLLTAKMAEKSFEYENNVVRYNMFIRISIIFSITLTYISYYFFNKK